MWAAVVCPKCGESVEVDLNAYVGHVFCRYCRENFELTNEVRARHAEEVPDDGSLSEAHLLDAQADSSFWLG